MDNNHESLYERIFFSKKILALISLVIVLFCFWNFKTEFSFYLFTDSNQSMIESGIGSMIIRDSIHLLKPDDLITVGMNPINYTNNKFKPPTFLQLVASNGYIPNENSIEFFDPLLILFRKTVFTSESVIVKRNGFHMTTLQCHPKYWNSSFSKFYSFKYISYYKYQSVVCIGHEHTSEFGHWFLEVLPCFFTIPQYILDNSIIVVPKIKKFIIEDLALFNISQERILAGQDLYFYAENLYMIHSRWCGDLNNKLIQNMKQKFIELFNLSKSKPYRYVLYNRINKSREIKNWDEVLTTVKADHPSIKFEIGLDFFTIKEQARYFNSIKLFFGVHGSIMANIIFMQPGTSVVELQMEKWLLSFIYLGGFTDINMIEGRDTNILHSAVQSTNVDPKYISRLISLGIEKLAAN